MDNYQIAESLIQHAFDEGWETLSLCHRGLLCLPESIGRLISLTTLRITGNRLTDLPESVGRLSKLRVLSAASNQFTAVPEALLRLSSLETLFLYWNKRVYI